MYKNAELENLTRCPFIFPPLPPPTPWHITPINFQLEPSLLLLKPHSIPSARLCIEKSAPTSLKTNMLDPLAESLCLWNLCTVVWAFWPRAVPTTFLLNNYNIRTYYFNKGALWKGSKALSSVEYNSMSEGELSRQSSGIAYPQKIFLKMGN